MRKRIWFFLFAVLLTCLSVVWVRWGLPRVEARLHRRISATLQSRLRRPVTLDHVHLHPLFLALTLENLRVASSSAAGAPDLFACRRWSLYLTPVHRAKRFPWIGLSFGKSEIEVPVVSLDALPRSGKPFSFSKTLALLPAHRLEWIGGAVHSPAFDPLPSFTLTDSRGSAVISGTEISVDIQGGTPWGPLRLAGRVGEPVFFGRARGPSWKGALIFPDIKLAELSALAPGKVPGSFEGTAETSLTFEGGFRKPFLREWSASMLFNKAGWNLDRRPFPVSGRITLSPKALSFHALTMSEGIVVNGNLRDPFGGAPQADFSVKAEKFSLEALRGRLPWKNLSALPWRGEADLRADLKGPLASPDLTASLNAREAGAGPLVLPTLETSLSSSPEKFRLEASFLGGRLEASADRGEQGSADWKCHLEGIRLDEAARAGGWGHVDGRLGGDFALQLSTGAPLAVRSARGLAPLAVLSVRGLAPLAGGVLRLDDPAWGDHRLSETLISYFSWRGDAVRFHNKEDTFDLQVRLTDDGWVLSRLAYARPDGLEIVAAGAVTGPERDLSFDGTLRRVPLRDFPFLLARAPALEGHTGMEVSLRGTASQPLLKASFKGDGARLVPDGPVHAFSGSLRREGEAFSLDAFSMDDTWSAAGSRLSDGQWQVSVTAQGADAGFFREISLSTASAGGRLDGRLAMSGGADGPQGRLEARVSGFHWGAVSVSTATVQARWEGDRAYLDDLVFSSAPYAGRAARRPDGRWDFDVEGPYLGHARGEALLREGSLSLTKVALGDGLGGELLLDAGAKTLLGRISLKDAPVEALARRGGIAAPEGRPGVMNGAVRFQGAWSSPEASADIRWTGARWRATPVETLFQARWREGFFHLDLLKASVGGGSVEARGTAPWERSAPVSVIIRGTSLPIALLGVPAEGSWDAEVSLEGSRGDPRASVSWRSSAVRVGDQPPFQAEVKGRWERRKFTVQEGRGFTPEGSWSVRPGGTLTFLDNGFDFDLADDLRNVRAGPLSLFGGLRLLGSWRGQAGLSVSLTSEDLWVNQQVFNGSLARVTFSRGRLSLEGSPGAPQRLEGEVDVSAWPHMTLKDVSLWEGGERRLKVNGGTGPDGWDLSAEGHGLQMNSLLSLADLGVSGDGPVDFFLTAKGDAARPRVEAEALSSKGSLNGFPYDRLSAAVLWKGSHVELRRLEAARRRGYLLLGRGEADFSDDPEVPPRVNLLMHLTEGDLSILKDLWPGCRRAKGSFHGELHVRPGPEGPVSAGFFSLADGAVSADRYVRELRDVAVVLRLKDNRVQLEDVSGKAGKGRWMMSGAFGLDGAAVSDYDLSLRTLGRRGIPVEVPQLSVPPGPFLSNFSLFRQSLEAPSVGTPRVDLTVKGPHGAHVIAGEIILDDTHFTYPPQKGAFKGISPHSWWGEFWREAIWDVTFGTGRDTWYRNEYVNVHVDGQVSVRGPRREVSVDGKVKADQGAITYLSQPFNVKRAVFEVATDTRPSVGEGQILAYISGEAERTATTLDSRGLASLDVVTMTIPRAPLGEIRPRFTSRNNPGLPSDRVFQKLLGFSASDQKPTTPEEQDQLLRAGLVQLVGSSAGPFAARLARLFGIDMIGVLYEPDAPSGDVRPTEALSAPRPGAEAPPNRAAGRLSDLLMGTGAFVGKRLNDRLSLGYKVKVDQTQRQVFYRDEIQFIGRLVGNLFARFSTELDSRSVLGQPPNRQAVLEEQWRFGLPRRKSEKKSKTEKK